MKLLALAGAALVLASCTGGETTIIREVQVTSPPTETIAPDTTETPTRVSTDEAIASAISFAPTLRELANSSIKSLMVTACESIDSWAPDYRGYLSSYRSVLSKESSTDQDEITAIIVAAIYSVCVEHQISILSLLDMDI